MQEKQLFSLFTQQFQQHILQEHIAHQATVTLHNDGLTVKNGFGTVHSAHQGAPLVPDGLLDEDTQAAFHDIVHEAWQRADTFYERDWVCRLTDDVETVNISMRSAQSLPFQTDQHCHMMTAHFQATIPHGMTWAHYDIPTDTLTPVIDGLPEKLLLDGGWRDHLAYDEVSWMYTADQGLTASLSSQGMLLTEQSDLTASHMTLLLPETDGTRWVIEQLADHPDHHTFADQVLVQQPEVLAAMLGREHVQVDSERLNTIVHAMKDDDYATLVQHYPDALQYAPPAKVYHDEIDIY